MYRSSTCRFSGGGRSILRRSSDRLPDAAQALFNRPNPHSGRRTVGLRRHRCTDRLHVDSVVADAASCAGLQIGYLMLRKLSSTGQTHTLAAVLSVFAAIDVPIVYMSIQWWRTQHPAPVFFSSDPNAGVDKSMYPAWFWNLGAWAMWGIFLVVFRYALERRRQASEQDAALQAIEASLEMAQ